MFKVDDKIIHNSYGLCKIAAIEHADAYHGNQNSYILYIKQVKIMIPVDRADMLRYPMKKEEVSKILEVLSESEGLEDKVHPKDRIKIYTEKLANNDILESAEVLKSLAFLNKKDKLSESEKNLFEHVNRALSDEISFVQNITTQEAQELINNRLKNIRNHTKCLSKHEY
jgi:RNA polymerase-interacting CarD/CdnL/TRCF family regulator